MQLAIEVRHRGELADDGRVVPYEIILLALFATMIVLFAAAYVARRLNICVTGIALLE